jgi:hypothetical protein
MNDITWYCLPFLVVATLFVLLCGEGQCEQTSVDLSPKTPADSLEDLTPHVSNTMTTAATTDVSIFEAMSYIALIESGNKDIGKHPDGMSWGRYGITVAAVRELARVGDVSNATMAAIAKEPQKLADPALNEQYAYLYLRLCYDEHHCTNWVDAAGWYHGGEISRQCKYKNRIMSEHEAHHADVPRSAAQ